MRDLLKTNSKIIKSMDDGTSIVSPIENDTAKENGSI